MNKPSPSLWAVRKAAASGFTLLEVMIALVVAVLVIGGVMGVYSVSLNYQQRINQRAQIMPIMEAVAQQILVNPQLALQGSVSLDEFGENGVVQIAAARVMEGDDSGLGKRKGLLYRVQLTCHNQMLEFSVIVPEEEEK